MFNKTREKKKKKTDMNVKNYNFGLCNVQCFEIYYTKSTIIFTTFD